MLNVFIAQIIAKLQEEDGLETVEWAGMIVVIIALLMAVAGVIGGLGEATIGQAIINTFASWIKRPRCLRSVRIAFSSTV